MSEQVRCVRVRNDAGSVVDGLELQGYDLSSLSGCGSCGLGAPPEQSKGQQLERPESPEPNTTSPKDLLMTKEGPARMRRALSRASSDVVAHSRAADKLASEVKSMAAREKGLLKRAAKGDRAAKLEHGRLSAQAVKLGRESLAARAKAARAAGVGAGLKFSLTMREKAAGLAKKNPEKAKQMLGTAAAAIIGTQEFAAAKIPVPLPEELNQTQDELVRSPDFPAHGGAENAGFFRGGGLGGLGGLGGIGDVFSSIGKGALTVVGTVGKYAGTAVGYLAGNEALGTQIGAAAQSVAKGVGSKVSSGSSGGSGGAGAQLPWMQQIEQQQQAAQQQWLALQNSRTGFNWKYLLVPAGLGAVGLGAYLFLKRR